MLCASGLGGYKDHAKRQVDVVAGLKKKGFEDGKSSHHKYYVYHTIEGKVSSVYTYTSHSGKELSDNLLSQMARQCQLKKGAFLKLIDCPMSRQEYEKELEQKQLL